MDKKFNPDLLAEDIQELATARINEFMSTRTNGTYSQDDLDDIADGLINSISDLSSVYLTVAANAADASGEPELANYYSSALCEFLLELCNEILELNYTLEQEAPKA